MAKVRLNLAQKRPWLVPAARLVGLALATAACGLLLGARLNFHQVQIVAHRGASLECPENTLIAFETAAQQGADWIELDVHQSRDGLLFVFHDHSLYRYLGVRRSVWELDYSAIAQLDIGSRFDPAFAGEHIPLFSEALDCIRQAGAKVNVEIKITGFETADYIAQILAAIHAADMDSRCLISCFDYSALVQVKQLNAAMPTTWLCNYMDMSWDNLACADCVNMSIANITYADVRQLHALGKKVFVWTVDDADIIDILLNWEVDGIVTNDVPLLLKHRSAHLPTAIERAFWRCFP